MPTTEKIYVRPKNENILVPNPENDGKPLAVEGEDVLHVRYWKRRIKDGDVVTSKLPKAKKDKS